MRIFCFEVVFAGMKNEWKAIARMGADHKIQAIKAYRDSFPEGKRPGLRETKEKVEAYMWKQGIHN